MYINCMIIVGLLCATVRCRTMNDYPLRLSSSFLINLDRRPDRLATVTDQLRMAGVNATRVSGVDGSNITGHYFKERQINLLPGYLDPYHQRPMKTGEIGCFLSHYEVWGRVRDGKETSAFVVEDDAVLQPDFLGKVDEILAEIKAMRIQWDLIYLGRKPMSQSRESRSDLLVYPGYSYWTVGYLINHIGAAKLMDARPLHKLVPVDEYLPIMFDSHPTYRWAQYFWPRNLKALSAIPLLVYPSHYTGDDEYFSDTESTPVIDGEFLAKGDSATVDDMSEIHEVKSEL